MVKRKYFVEVGQQFGRLTVTGSEFRKVTPGEPAGRPGVPCVCECGRERVVLIKSLVSGKTQSCGHHTIPPAHAVEQLIELSRSPEGRARSAALGRSPERRARLRAWALTPEGRAHLDMLAKSPKRIARAKEYSSSPESLARLAGLWQSPEFRAKMADSHRTHGLSEHPCYRIWVGMMHRCHNPDFPNYSGYGGRGIQVCPEWREDVAVFVAWMDENLGPRPEGCSIDRIDNDGNYEPGNVRWATASQQRRNQRAECERQRDDQGRWMAEG